MFVLKAFLYAALVERHGSRVACMAGSALAAFGFLTSAFVPNIYLLYVTYGVLSGKQTLGVCIIHQINPFMQTLYICNSTIYSLVTL